MKEKVRFKLSDSLRFLDIYTLGGGSVACILEDCELITDAARVFVDAGRLSVPHVEAWGRGVRLVMTVCVDDFSTVRKDIPQLVKDRSQRWLALPYQPATPRLKEMQIQLSAAKDEADDKPGELIADALQNVETMLGAYGYDNLGNVIP